VTGGRGPLLALLRLPVDHARNALRGLFARVSPRTVVQAVVLGEGGVLFALRSDLMGWELPGGARERGEGDEAALRREVQEETGLAIAVDGLVGEYTRRGFFAHTARVYRAHVVGGAPRPSVETAQLAWFDPRALPETVFPWFRGPTLDAFRGPLPVAREERLGLRAIWAGLRIDFRLRAAR
jgi:8-oxo-dGTP pyrophosphatase MutT (NUDIX family)